MANTLKSVQPELERAYDKIIAWFFAYPEMQTLTQLRKEIKVSRTATREAVLVLEKEGFLEKKVVGGAWIIKANPGHAYFTTKKIPQNLMHIYESGILDAVYKKIPNANAVILFGSYRKGDDVPESDIDIAAEVTGDKQLEIVELGTIRQLGYRKNVKVKLHIFSRSKVDINLFANITNGIILSGFLEVHQ